MRNFPFLSDNSTANRTFRDRQPEKYWAINLTNKRALPFFTAKVFQNIVVLTTHQIIDVYGYKRKNLTEEPSQRYSFQPPAGLPPLKPQI